MKKSTYFYDIKQSSLGYILLAQENDAICALFIGKDIDLLIQDLFLRFKSVSFIQNNIYIKKNMDIVINFIETLHSHSIFPSLSLSLYGTLFQKEVWDFLQTIPLGHTITYSDIAKKINKPLSVRAIANACGANPISILIPCHRVLRKNGDLGGYRWGIDVKKLLLEKEKVKY